MKQLTSVTPAIAPCGNWRHEYSFEIYPIMIELIQNTAILILKVSWLEHVPAFSKCTKSVGRPLVINTTFASSVSQLHFIQ